MAAEPTDTERLEWLEPRLGLLEVFTNEAGERMYGFSLDRSTFYPTLRAAIDGNMRAEQE